MASAFPTKAEGATPATGGALGVLFTATMDFDDDFLQENLS